MFYEEVVHSLLDGDEEKAAELKVREWIYDDSPVHLQRGEEMGRFLLGSTVVLLWPRDTIAFHSDWAPGNTVRLGEAMATDAGRRMAWARLAVMRQYLHALAAELGQPLPQDWGL